MNYITITITMTENCTRLNKDDVQEAAEAAKHEAKSRSEATDAAKRHAQDALDDWKKAALHEKTSATNAIAKAQLAAGALLL